MGLRLRLRAPFPVAGFAIAVQSILVALKTYGMFVADNGSNLFLSGAPDPRWSDDDLGTLRNVHGSDFDVIRMDGLGKRLTATRHRSQCNCAAYAERKHGSRNATSATNTAHAPAFSAAAAGAPSSTLTAPPSREPTGVEPMASVSAPSARPRGTSVELSSTIVSKRRKRGLTHAA
jgi:hypothetical protein